MSGLKPSQLISRAEIDEAYDNIHAENEKLRMLLWLRHGCAALYGDDGEMQCGSCLIDFKRDTADSIERKWLTENEKAIEEYMKNQKQTDSACAHEWEPWEVKEDPICKKCGECVSDLKFQR